MSITFSLACAVDEAFCERQAVNKRRQATGKAPPDLVPSASQPQRPRRGEGMRAAVVVTGLEGDLGTGQLAALIHQSERLTRRPGERVSHPTRCGRSKRETSV
ncbi:MAG: hypothetical protein JWO62_309, partial [Acidimicrobiaceae bacterium]|nr:hypothetical protein [Acidimicrobiaceae bacterium]